MKITEYARRLDPNGRLVIPSKLREAVGMTAGETYTFYIHEDDEGKYLCVKVGENDIATARRLLEAAGLKVSE